MNKKQNMPPLSELNLTNRFLFDQVMEDPQTHQDALSIIFDRDIPLLTHNETEKELRTVPSVRSIRMDVFAMDEDNTIYNTEMQARKKTDLAKRSRYYQSIVDSSLLVPGIPDYNKLNTSYIIMIMPFDLFGYGKYCYSFEAVCKEVPECRLGDGAHRIFLNTRGKNDNEVSEELRDFLHYIEHSTDAAAANSSSEKLRRIHKRVCDVRSSEEAGVKYMQAWEERYFDRQESWMEGMQEGQRIGREEGIQEGQRIGREEGIQEGQRMGREEGIQEGQAQGKHAKLKEMIQKKLAKGKLTEQIADELEEDPAVVLEIIKDLQAESE